MVRNRSLLSRWLAGGTSGAGRISPGVSVPLTPQVVLCPVPARNHVRVRLGMGLSSGPVAEPGLSLLRLVSAVMAGS